jgi:hypothetical protein
MLDIPTIVENAQFAHLLEQSRLLTGAKQEVADWAAQGKDHPLLRYWLDRANLIEDLRLDPFDGWHGGATDYQKRVLRSQARFIMTIMARQIGKTFCDVAWAIWTMLCEAPARVVFITTSFKEKGFDFIREFVKYYLRLCDMPTFSKIVMPQNSRQITLENGSELLALPTNERTIRGKSDVKLLIIDEGAFVDDVIYYAVRPFTDRVKGRILASSTAMYKQGWLWRAYADSEFIARQREKGEWKDDVATWDVHRVKIWECPWQDHATIRANQREMTQAAFEADYECGFRDTEEGVFRETDIQAMFDRGIEMGGGGSF